MAQTLKKAMAETLNGPNSQWPKPPQKQLDQTVEVLPWQSYSVVDSAYAIDGILLRRLQVERQVNLHSAYDQGLWKALVSLKKVGYATPVAVSEGGLTFGGWVMDKLELFQLGTFFTPLAYIQKITM